MVAQNLQARLELEYGEATSATISSGSDVWQLALTLQEVAELEELGGIGAPIVETAPASLRS